MHVDPLVTFSNVSILHHLLCPQLGVSGHEIAHFSIHTYTHLGLQATILPCHVHSVPYGSNICAL
jgi:hypothetical protein